MGTVSIADTDNLALVDTLVTPLSSDGVDILNAPINYTIYSPFFPPFFPPSFCSCGACSFQGSYSCDGQMRYEYWVCGCVGCPGEGGYNGAYVDGYCGYSAAACSGGGPCGCFCAECGGYGGWECIYNACGHFVGCND